MLAKHVQSTFLFFHSHPYLVCLVPLVSLVSWFVWLLSFFEPNQLNKQDEPNKPDRPNEQDRLADFFSILLTARSVDPLSQKHCMGMI